ncbi:hypothetical protein ACFYNN_27885 [Streptomyces sp. NPDC006978]|uniref:hypothetical protein n=1 Tax=unclassified Streptomyces TaxID=2593676 RepID=UPI002AFDF281|nr:hypothetical protein [Streptomyces sp. S584]
MLLRGAGVSGLNPKALLLTACAVVYLAVGLLARTVLGTRPGAARAVTRISGVMMIAIGGLLLLERTAGW